MGMNEHDQTKYIFAQSIKDLMAKQPLDKITVTDIVKHSGMTRQTFYRYFQDKYDLVNWYFEKLADKSCLLYTSYFIFIVFTSFDFI